MAVGSNQAIGDNKASSSHPRSQRGQPIIGKSDPVNTKNVANRPAIAIQHQAGHFLLLAQFGHLGSQLSDLAIQRVRSVMVARHQVGRGGHQHRRQQGSRQ